MAESNRLLQPSPEARHADDWEARALNRVAARVDELPSLPAEAEDFGWEAGVLEKLSKRLNATD